MKTTETFKVNFFLDTVRIFSQVIFDAVSPTSDYMGPRIKRPLPITPNFPFIKFLLFVPLTLDSCF